MVQLSEAIARLGKQGLPRHSSESVLEFVGALASHLPAPLRPLIKMLGNPTLGPAVLNLLPDPSVKRAFRALLGNTASPTPDRPASGYRSPALRYRQSPIRARVAPARQQR